MILLERDKKSGKVYDTHTHIELVHSANNVERQNTMKKSLAVKLLYRMYVGVSVYNII